MSQMCWTSITFRRPSDGWVVELPDHEDPVDLRDWVEEVADLMDAWRDDGAELCTIEGQANYGVNAFDHLPIEETLRLLNSGYAILDAGVTGQFSPAVRCWEPGWRCPIERVADDDGNPVITAGELSVLEELAEGDPATTLDLIKRYLKPEPVLPGEVGGA